MFNPHNSQHNLQPSGHAVLGVVLLQLRGDYFDVSSDNLGDPLGCEWKPPIISKPTARTKIDVGVIHLLLVILAYTTLTGIARTCGFQNIFKGADAVGSMCEALKRYVALKMFKPKAMR